MDVNLKLQEDVSKELIHPKYFSVDWKVEEFFSCVTVNELLLAVESFQEIGKIEDYGSLLLTLLTSKLHFHVVNTKHVPARHRSACISVAMLLFISIHSISPISNVNVVLESIANIFWV